MQDYLGILEHLLKRWNVGNLTGLSPEAAEAQDRVCNLPARYRWALHMLCTLRTAASGCDQAAVQQASMVSDPTEACLSVLFVLCVC